MVPSVESSENKIISNVYTKNLQIRLSGEFVYLLCSDAWCKVLPTQLTGPYDSYE
jgi:hypothetical protein